MLAFFWWGSTGDRLIALLGGPGLSDLPGEVLLGLAKVGERAVSHNRPVFVLDSIEHRNDIAAAQFGNRLRPDARSHTPVKDALDRC